MRLDISRKAPSQTWNVMVGWFEGGCQLYGCDARFRPRPRMYFASSPTTYSDPTLVTGSSVVRKPYLIRAIDPMMLCRFLEFDGEVYVERRLGWNLVKDNTPLNGWFTLHVGPVAPGHNYGKVASDG